MPVLTDFYVFGKYFPAPIRRGWGAFIDAIIGGGPPLRPSIALVYNDTGALLTAGDIVYVNGDHVGVPSVKLTNADDEKTASKQLFCIQEPIIAGAIGDGVSRGEVTGLVGLTPSAAQYLSTTDGEMTETAPIGPEEVVRIIGHAMSATVLFFDPDVTWLEISDAGALAAKVNDFEIDATALGGELSGEYLLRDGSVPLTGEWGLGGTYGISEINYLDFDLTPTEAGQEGRLQWNPADGTLDLGMPGGNVNLQIGLEMIVLCHNDSGGDIDNGEVVYITGSSGTKPTIGLSKADAKATTFVLGVATENILDGTDGYVTSSGLVRDIDTSVAVAGAPVFLSAVTAGALAAAPPNAPNYKARVGYVIVQDATNGVLLVDSGVVPLLRSLGDVETQPPAPNDCPVWSSDNQWFDMTNIGGFFNGTFIETFSTSLAEAGGVVTMSLQQTGGGDLTMKFSGGEYDLDCTPPKTIALTVGTDSVPVSNYIYIPETTMVLTKSTTQWPDVEHIKVAYFFLGSAAYVALDGAYIHQNWNDHREGTNGQGHLAHVCEAIRLTMRGASWHSGVEGDATGAEYLELAASNIDFKSTAGVCYQMHQHTIPAVDMSTGTDAHVVNWSGDPYHAVADLFEIVDDALGSSLNNKYFNLDFWMVANSTGTYSPQMFNLPTGSYVGLTNAIADVDGFDVLSIPHEFTADSCTGFLVCRLTIRKQGTTWTLLNTTDLRGVIPASGASGGSGGAAITDFSDNLFTIYDADDVTRILDFDLTNITSGNTRTVSPSDAPMTIPATADYLDLTDGGDTILHKHDTMYVKLIVSAIDGNFPMMDGVTAGLRTSSYGPNDFLNITGDTMEGDLLMDGFDLYMGDGTGTGTPGQMLCPSSFSMRYWTGAAWGGFLTVYPAASLGFGQPDPGGTMVTKLYSGSDVVEFDAGWQCPAGSPANYSELDNATGDLNQYGAALIDTEATVNADEGFISKDVFFNKVKAMSNNVSQNFFKWGVGASAGDSVGYTIHFRIKVEYTALSTTYHWARSGVLEGELLFNGTNTYGSGATVVWKGAAICRNAAGGSATPTMNETVVQGSAGSAATAGPYFFVNLASGTFVSAECEYGVIFTGDADESYFTTF